MYIFLSDIWHFCEPANQYNFHANIFRDIPIPWMSYGVKLDIGAVWDICWCPTGAWDDPDKPPKDPARHRRLGMVAVASSVGYVTIIRSVVDTSSVNLIIQDICNLR